MASLLLFFKFKFKLGAFNVPDFQFFGWSQFGPCLGVGPVLGEKGDPCNNLPREAGWGWGRPADASLV